MTSRVSLLPLPQWLVQLVLEHRWDNSESLQNFLSNIKTTVTAGAGSATVPAKKEPVQLTIFHEDRDEIVPVAMGRTLASLAAELDSDSIASEYVEVLGGDHNRILGKCVVG